MQDLDQQRDEQQFESLAALPLEKIMRREFNSHFSELYIGYYIAPAQAQRFTNWRYYALKELEGQIAPSRVEPLDGELRSIIPVSPEMYVIRQESIEAQYKRYMRRIHKKHKAFYIAFREVLTEDEQTYFKRFYERETVEDELFMRLNKRLERLIHDMDAFPDVWENDVITA